MLPETRGKGKPCNKLRGNKRGQRSRLQTRRHPKKTAATNNKPKKPNKKILPSGFDAYFLPQVIGTGALILCILAITDRKNIGAPKGMEPLCIGLIIMAIAVSMGLNCGYPINPARDLGPRFFTAVAGWGMDVFR